MEGPPIRLVEANGKQTSRSGHRHASHANCGLLSICYRAASGRTAAAVILMLRRSNKAIRWVEIQIGGLDHPKLELRTSGALGNARTSRRRRRDPQIVDRRSRKLPRSFA